MKKFQDKSQIRNQVCLIAALISLFCGQLSLMAQSTLIEEDTIAYSIDIEGLVVTGQLAPTHYKNASHKVNVISSEEINQKGHTQLQEVLTSLPNVRLTYDPILGTSITLRGVASDNVNVMIDGVPVVGRLDGALDISQINLQDIVRIEIIEGPLSVLYGNNAAGGVINIITKSVLQDQLKIDLDSQYELPGIHNHGAHIGGSKNKLFFKLGANYHKHQLYPLDSTRIFEELPLENGDTYLIKKYPFNPKERININGQVGLQLNEDRKLSLKWSEAEEKIINLGAIRRPTFKPYARDNEFITRRSDQSFTYKDLFNQHYFLNFTLAQNGYNRTSFYNRFELEGDTINQALSTVDTFNYQASFAKLDFSSNSLPWLHLLGGITYNREEAQGERILDPEDDDAVADLTDLAGFGSVKYNATRNLSVALSGRYAWNSNYNTPFVPAAQLLWKINPYLNARIGYAHGFRAPSLKELYLNFVDQTHNVKGNIDLMPESSRDYSSSLSYQRKHWDWDIGLDLQAYHNKIDQKIVLAEISQGPLEFQYSNIEEFTSYGFGAGFSIEGKNWGLKSSGSLGFRDNNLEAVEKVARVVDLQSELTYEFPYDIRSLLVHRYFGATPKFQLQGEEVVENITAAYELVDLSFSKKFMKNDALRLGVGIKNMLDLKRADIEGNSLNTGMHITSSPVQIISQGRTFFLKLGYSFSQ